MSVDPNFFGLSGFAFPAGTGSSSLTLYPAPVLTPSRTSSTSLSVAVAGTPAAQYRVWAVGPRLLGATLLGTTAGNTTLSGTGLVAGGDYLLWAAAFDGATGAYVSPVAFAAVSLADLDSVLAAFRRTLAASPATQQVLTGGLWTNEVPEDVNLPYGFVELLDSRFQWTTEDFHVEVARVRVHVYAAGGEAAERVRQAVNALYAWQDLQFSDGSNNTTCQVMPTDYAVQSEFARLKDGQVVYQATGEYEVMVNRNFLSS